MNEEEHDEGWVDPVWCSDWTLYDAAQEIENEAFRLAAEQLQNEALPDQDCFFELVRYFKKLMWEGAQCLLKAEYPFLDLENFSYHLQYFAIEGPDDPNQYPEPDIVEDGQDDANEAFREESDSIPSADELEDWMEG